MLTFSLFANNIKELRTLEYVTKINVINLEKIQVVFLGSCSAWNIDIYTILYLICIITFMKKLRHFFFYLFSFLKRAIEKPFQHPYKKIQEPVNRIGLRIGCIKISIPWYLGTLVRLCSSTAGCSPPPTLSIAVYLGIFLSSLVQHISQCLYPILYAVFLSGGWFECPRRCIYRSTCCLTFCRCGLPISISFSVCTLRHL